MSDIAISDDEARFDVALCRVAPVAHEAGGRYERPGVASTAHPERWMEHRFPDIYGALP